MNPDQEKELLELTRHQNNMIAHLGLMLGRLVTNSYILVILALLILVILFFK